VRLCRSELRSEGVILHAEEFESLYYPCAHLQSQERGDVKYDGSLKWIMAFEAFRLI
jgi:hypothetical protein